MAKTKYSSSSSPKKSSKKSPVRKANKRKSPVSKYCVTVGAKADVSGKKHCPKGTMRVSIVKKSPKPCKPGKSPNGKDGRCVNNSPKKRTYTKKPCGPGKSPNGKNGRCVKNSPKKKKPTGPCRDPKKVRDASGKCVENKNLLTRFIESF